MKKKLSGHKLTIIIILCMIIPLAYGMYWLFGLLIVPFIISQSFVYLSHKFLKGNFQSGTVFISWMLLAIAYSIICKLFVLDIYRVTSESMESTLKKGDVLLINKLTYGPLAIKKPGEISWIKIFQKNNPLNNEDGCALVGRKTGYSQIGRNDIFVYELFSNYFVVKRCIGLPGDVIKIANDSAFINNQFINFPKYSINEYRLNFSQHGKLRELITTIPQEAITSVNIDSNFFIASLPNILFLKAMQHPGVHIERLLNKQLQGKAPYFRPGFWTINNMGPLTIPFKGCTITIDSGNNSIYSTTIQRWECYNRLKEGVSNASFQYSFAENYYFMMGDNKPLSEDSRYLGVIPEKNIVGKVALILYSYADGKFIWNRLFKSI